MLIARTIFGRGFMMRKKLDITSPAVSTLLQQDVLQLCGIFIKNGYEIRLVGGCVRDMLVKRKPKDIDLSTTAQPEQMIQMFKDNKIRYIETGLSHGTLTVHLNHKDFEITTLRIDKETFGRKAKVEFTNDWKLDAERRDLTVNSMSLDVDGNLYDYFGGESDLMKGKVCFVGDASLRIREDYLRILRYFRFYGKIAPNESNHDQDTLDVIKKLAPGLERIAVERIWVEVSKILTGNIAPHLLRTMYKFDTAKHIGLPDCTEDQLREFETVWKRCDVENIQPVALLIALVQNETQARELCLKWKLSNYQKLLSCFIASNRYLPVNEQHPLKIYQDIIVRSPSEQTIEMVDQLLNYQGKHDERENIRKWDIPKFPITGADLKQHGVKSGPGFGKIMNKLKELWIESRYELTKELLTEEILRLVAR